MWTLKDNVVYIDCIYQSKLSSTKQLTYNLIHGNDVKTQSMFRVVLVDSKEYCIDVVWRAYESAIERI